MESRPEHANENLPHSTFTNRSTALTRPLSRYCAMSATAAFSPFHDFQATRNLRAMQYQNINTRRQPLGANVLLPLSDFGFF